MTAKTLAKQYNDDFEKACAPLHFALSTRAGTECVAYALRAATELNTELTILSVDDIEAYDMMRRRAMLEKLHTLPRARAILPFVRMSYGAPSTYQSQDDEDTVHTILQGEGEEQGDSLMPTLCSLGQHDALKAVQR